MKKVSCVLALLGSFSASAASAAGPCTPAKMEQVALKMGVELGYKAKLTYVRKYIEATIEKMAVSPTDRSRKFQVISTFNSSEEHEFIRSIVIVDTRCAVVSTRVIQDSRF